MELVKKSKREKTTVACLLDENAGQLCKQKWSEYRIGRKEKDAETNEKMERLRKKKTLGWKIYDKKYNDWWDSRCIVTNSNRV